MVWSKKAITSFIFGIIATGTFIITGTAKNLFLWAAESAPWPTNKATIILLIIVSSILAIIFGIKALQDIKIDSSIEGNTLSLVGVIFGILPLLLYILPIFIILITWRN